MLSKDIALLVIALVAGGFAAQPQVAFDNNRENILSGNCYKVGGYYFGVGRGVVRTTRSTSDNFAKEKAVQDAQASLVGRKAMEGVIWPNSLDKHSVAILKRLALRFVSLQADIDGVVVVSVEKSGVAMYTAVVAAPESNLQYVQRASFDEIKSGLLNPHWLKSNFKKSAKELYQFYLTQKKLPDELVGTAYADWSDEQLDIFCGIPRVVVNTNSVPSKVEGKTRGKSDGAEVRQGFVGNINETIDF